MLSWIFLYSLYVVLDNNIAESGPVCEEAYAYIEVAEDTPIGTVVKEIRCERSPSSSSDLSYTITDGNTNGKFGINSTDNVGYVFVYQSISFESRITSFQLSIEIAESSPYRATVNFVLDIQVTGVNDYAPLFLFSPYTVYINEDVGPGTVISKPIPYDFDKGNDGSTTSSIIDGDDSLFYMDPKTAKVYLRKELDYERQTTYAITIQVTDNGIPLRRSSTSVINVYVKDVNDNPPICDDTYLTETFEETKEEGSVIKFIKCSDADSGNNGRLSYTIAEGDYTKFRLQGPYLLLSKQVDVDREPKIWTLSVRVRDRGNPRLSTMVDIVLYVEGVDDNSPVWAAPYNGVYVIDLEENTPVGTRLIQIAADDLDKSESRDAAVVYYMDDYSHVFAIRPKTGDIFLNHDLDREKISNYKIPVSAVSIDNPGDRITTDVIINVKDVNDNAPEFEKDVFQYFVQENVEVQSEIANITASDSDIEENGEVLYMIVDGNTNSVFDINTQTGLISVVGRLDYESQTSYSILVRATDRGRPARSSTCTVIISIIPVNEFEPLIRDMNTVNILEDMPIGQSLLKIEASDGDKGVDGKLHYSIESGGYPFTVEPLTGIVRLLHQLDRETSPSYKIVIKVSDLSETEAKFAKTSVDVNILDVNDNAPECNTFYMETLSPPIQSGDIIVSLNCTDRDDGQNSRLSYTILSGNINSDMSISYDGGVTVLRNPSAAEYRLEIEIRDGGTPSLSTQAIVVVTTGSKPLFKNLPASIDVSEDVIIGKSVFQVESMSVSKQIKYEITNIYFEISDKPKTDPVKIDSFTGIIYTWKKFDREMTEKMTIAVKATDLISKIEVESTLTLDIVDVNDNSPTFDKAIYNISVVENVPPMSELLRVTVTDADSGNNGLFDLAILNNSDNSFVIDKNGLIRTRSDIDREQTDRYTLVVTATDRGRDIRFTSTATVLVLVTDSDEYSPEFIDIASDLETRLSEDTALGSKIFVLEARDFDANAQLTYSLLNSDDLNFLIDKTTGSIYLSRILDREEVDTYLLIVQVVDDGQKTATTTVTVIVTDVNDNSPQFESHIFKFEVSSSAKPGYVVGTIFVDDKDLDQNGYITMTITDGNIDGVFEIEGDELRIAGSLDYDKMTQYLLILEAKDNGLPRRTSSATVIIEVEPELKQPKFAADHQMVNLTENLYIGYLVFDFDATILGAKEGNANELVYSLLSGNENGMFALDKKSGQLTLARSLDREVNGDFHTMVVIATNMYDNSLTAELEIDVKVDDVNDNPPQFDRDRYSFDVKENESEGTKFGKVFATDNDQGQNADVSYEIIGGSDIQDTFAIDMKTGELSLKRKLNYLYDQVYHFSVNAYDHGSPALKSKTMLTVNIIDVNNNAPVFDHEQFTVSVRENVDVGKQVYQLNARDDDSGINAELLFRIVGGNEGGYFELDSENGALRSSKALDREKADIFELIIEAEDKGSPSLAGSCTVTVLVSDVNDHAPTFEREVFTVSLNRFVPIETSVITLKAHDNDIRENAEINYQLTGADESYFQIDSVSGYIYTFADLSTLENDIELTVVAKDRGMPRLSSSTTIDIQLHPTKFKEVEDYSFSVSEYDPPNTFVGTLGTQSGMKYAIEKGNFKNNFRVSEEDGNIFLQGILDREEYSDYFLIVKSYHRLTPNLENLLSVHITVQDENDNNPEFIQEEYRFLVLEHTPIGFSVAKISAIDRDSGERGNVSYLFADENMNKFFSINSNGSIFVKESISYNMINKINATVVAVDNGQFSRSGSCQVVIDIVDIDEQSFEPGSGRRSNLLSVQVPVTASNGYILMTLKPAHFGLGNANSKIRYVTQDNRNIFKVDELSGNIVVQSSENVAAGFSYWLWVVARVTDVIGQKENLALIRIESFQPGRHVVVFTHGVSLHILEMNRDLFLEELQKVLPSTYPVIWKLEGDDNFSRRKLLQSSSKSFIYFLRNNETNLDEEFEEDQRFVHQDELMEMLTLTDGQVTEKLNNEGFDNFPIISVSRYKEPADEKGAWIKSKIGLISIGVCTGIVLLVLIIAFAILVKKKCNQGLCMKSKTKSWNGITPYPKPVEPLYNNIKSKKSLPDTLTMMDSLRVLAKMNEEDRDEILQKTFNTKQTDEIIALNSNLNRARMSSVVQYSVHDETNNKAPRKVSNEIADTNTKINKPQMSGKRKISSATDDRKDRKESRKISVGSPAQRKSTSSSVSSLELDPGPAVGEAAFDSEVIENVIGKESVDEPGVNKDQHMQNNRTLIIAGKEYDGVGKDTKTNGKYLYNTRTGEKLHVTDDVLKRAVQQRQSVVQPEFNEAQHGGRVSTFKKPLKRKMSRSRFSTTTIWEMSVDPENGGNSDTFTDNQVPIENVDEVSETSSKSDIGKQRRVGIDHTPKVHQQPSYLTSGLSEEHKYEDKPNNKWKTDVKQVDSDTTISEESDTQDSSPESEVGDLETVLAETVKPTETGESSIGRKISANVKWDKLLANTVPSPNNGSASEEKTENKWTKAHKIVRYVRPVYKPINLDNVTCKVPKGKSDPKDCLSKDPVYAGWAKLVGRRMKKTVIKTKEGPSKTVVSREGRSLPASLFATQKPQIPPKPKPKDVVTYTKIVSSLTPPHLAKKRMSISTE